MTTAEKLAFIAKIKPLALASQTKFGIPAAVTVAQAILESAWGGSDVAREKNNYLGIRVRITKTDYVYREFPSIDDCFEYHGELIGKGRRYARARWCASDPIAFAQRLQDAGYSEDPDYAAKLQTLISQFGLATNLKAEAAS